MKLPIHADEEIGLPAIESWPQSRHRFDRLSIQAVRAAILCGRPLLLRGEPGIGKSQLARAIATKLDVPFLYTVLDDRSERDDLFYQYDAIARLSEAQISGEVADKDRRERLAESNFIRPGVLWWGFNWESAETQISAYERATGRKLLRWSIPKDGAKQPWTPTADRSCGPVVLIDEIDKTDPSVPNGLLEGLGNKGFRTDQLGHAVRLPEEKGAKPPLIFITTNEERELPAAFLRRCLVLRMSFPDDEDAAKFLIERAEVQCSASLPDKGLLNEIVKQLLDERRKAKSKGWSKPGAAEFLDLVRILSQLDPDAAAAEWNEMARFTFRKHVEPER